MTDREIALDRVGSILRLQYNGKVMESQKVYEWLLGWCDGKGFDFNEIFKGAQAYLLKTAVGFQDTLAYRGVMKEPA